MKKFALLLIIPLLSITSVFGNSNHFDLAIKNVDIFDSNTKKVLKNKTILIKGDEIVSIVKSSKKFKASKTIEGNSRLVIPGFIDTHTHILQIYGTKNFDRNYVLEDEVLEDYKKLTARQYLANGITTIFDMAQPEPWIETTLKMQKNPSPNYPNLFINGSSTISDLRWDRNPPLHHWKIFNKEDAQKKVQKYAKLGVKHMKLYWKLELEDMKNLVEEAKKNDIILNAHVDNNIVTIPQAMDLGVKNFEHFFTVIPSILNFEETNPKLNEKYGLDRRWNIDKFASNMAFYFGYIDDNPELEKKLLELFDRMAKENASISTAMNVLASSTGRAYSFSSFDRLPARTKPQTNYNETQKKQLNQAFKSMLKFMKVAHDIGVNIRIGSDTPYGGEAFISELLLFSEEGFPIEDVLQIATINGAKALKIDDRYGSVEVGKKADLVIFENSPFDNYKNFQSKKTVIKGGKVFNLEKSLAFATMEKMKSEGIGAGLKFFKEHKKSGKFGSPDEAELNEIAFQLFANEKVDLGIAVYKLRDEIFPQSGKVYNALTENELNSFGYYLLGANKNLDALSVFKYNVLKHPKSANVYDSLAEGYLNVDNKKLALVNYKKAVELNPQNYNAIQIINELEGKEIKVDSSILDSYKGKYEFRKDVIWNIRNENGKLTFQENNGNKVTLEAISNEIFVLPRANINISFEKDSDGKIINLIFNQGGRELKAKRL